MATPVQWEPLRLSPPGTRLAVDAGRYQLHLRLPACFRGSAPSFIRSWGYRLVRVIPHPTEPGVTVAEIEIPARDAITITGWFLRAFKHT